MASYAIATQFLPALSGLLSGLLLATRGPVHALATYAACVACVATSGALLMPALRGYRRAQATGRHAGGGGPLAYKCAGPVLPGLFFQV